MKKNAYDGPDRRAFPISDRRTICAITCHEHSGIAERLNNVEDKTDGLENEKFLRTNSFYWIIGILLSILVSVLSATLYTAFQTSEALRQVKENQVALSVQLTFLQKDIEDIKKKVP